MIDFEGFDISSSESKKIVGISDKLTYAREHGKMILCYRLKNGGVYVNANPTAVDANGNLWFDGLAVVLNVVTTGADKDTVSVVSNAMKSIINGGAKNFCPVNTATLASDGNMIAKTAVVIPAGEYIVTFDATNVVSAMRWEMTCFPADGSASFKPQSAVDKVVKTATEYKFTTTKALGYVQIYVSGIGSSASVFSNIMIRPSAFADGSYVAYSPTNAELNARVYALEHPTQQSKNGEGVFQTEEETETKTTRKKS